MGLGIEPRALCMLRKALYHGATLAALCVLILKMDVNTKIL